MKSFISILLIILALAVLASAKDKRSAKGDYHDGVLVKFQMVKSGESCSSTGSGQVNDDGQVSVSNSGSCSEKSVAHYTIVVGDISYVLSPAVTHPKTAIFTLGYSAAFQKDSVLYAQLPGTPVKVRVKKGKVYVRIGDRESPYHVVSVASTAKGER
jgi:hypothetical protein